MIVINFGTCKKERKILITELERSRPSPRFRPRPVQQASAIHAKEQSVAFIQRQGKKRSQIPARDHYSNFVLPDLAKNLKLLLLII